MTLLECLEKIKEPRDWDIRFYEDQPLVRPYTHTVTDNLHTLFKEWFLAGPGLSGNDKPIFGITFGHKDGQIAMVNDSEVITFDKLMKAVEEYVINRDAPNN